MIDVAQDRDRWRALINTVMNLRVSYNVGNSLTSCGPVNFSGWSLIHGVNFLYYYLTTFSFEHVEVIDYDVILGHYPITSVDGLQRKIS